MGARVVLALDLLLAAGHTDRTRRRRCARVALRGADDDLDLDAGVALAGDKGLFAGRLRQTLGVAAGRLGGGGVGAAGDDGEAVLAALLFGASPPVVKLLTVDVGPNAAAALLYLGSGLGLLVLLVVKLLRGQVIAPIPREARGRFAGAILAGTAMTPITSMPMRVMMAMTSAMRPCATPTAIAMSPRCTATPIPPTCTTATSTGEAGR